MVIAYPKAQLALATATPAIISDEQLTSSLAGQVIVGAALAIVKICVQLAVRLQASVIV